MDYFQAQNKYRQKQLRFVFHFCIKLLKKLNIGHPIVAGHSMGGLVALKLSLLIAVKQTILDLFFFAINFLILIIYSSSIVLGGFEVIS